MKSSQHRKPVCIEPEEADKAHGFNLAQKSFIKISYTVSALFRSIVRSNATSSMYREAYRTKMAVMQTGGVQKEKGMRKTKNPYSPGTRGAYLESSTTTLQRNESYY